jgi:hypothetical protein
MNLPSIKKQIPTYQEGILHEVSDSALFGNGRALHRLCGKNITAGGF